jgi:hypothetical protein
MREQLDNVFGGPSLPPSRTPAPVADASSDPGQADPSHGDRQPANAESDQGAGDTGTTEPSEQGAAEGSATAGEGETQENADAPGDDIVRELEELGKQFAAPAEDQPPGDPSEQQPTAESTGEQADTAAEAQSLLAGKEWTPEQQAQARSFIGKQGRELGEHRKFFKQASQFIGAGKDGKLSFNLDAIVETMGPDAISQYVAKSGYQLVPAGVKVDLPDPVEADLRAVVNEMLPGDELTHDEKLEELRGNPVTDRKLRDALERKSRDRQGQSEAKLTEQRAQATAYIETLHKLPYYAEVKPALKYWNEKLPEVPGFEGVERLEVVKRLAEASRFPAIAKRLQKSVREAADKEWQSKYGMAAIPGDGANPVYVSPADDADRQAAIKARANRFRAEAAKAF